MDWLSLQRSSQFCQNKQKIWLIFHFVRCTTYDVKDQLIQLINQERDKIWKACKSHFTLFEVFETRINMSVNVVNLSKKEHLSSNSLIKRSGKRKKKARVKSTISIALRHRLATISFSSHVLIIQNGRRSAQIQKPGWIFMSCVL